MGFRVRRSTQAPWLWSVYHVLLGSRAAGSNASLSAHGVIVHQEQG